MEFYQYLESINACEPAQEWAEGKTWEEVYQSCDRGDWLCWLFARTNPEDIRLLTLVKGLQANEVRHLMTHPDSIAAVDAAIAYGRGELSLADLKAAAAAAYSASAAKTAAAAAYSAAAYSAAYSAAAYSAYSAYEAALKKSADIFRANIPIEKINRVWETI